MIKYYCDACGNQTTPLSLSAYENFRLDARGRDVPSKLHGMKGVKHIDPCTYKLCLCAACEGAVLDALESRKKNAD